MEKERKKRKWCKRNKLLSYQLFIPSNENLLRTLQKKTGELIPGTTGNTVFQAGSSREESALGGTESSNLRVSTGFPLVRGETAPTQPQRQREQWDQLDNREGLALGREPLGRRNSAEAGRLESRKPR